MPIQPLDIPALLRAITWPLIVVTAFAIFRRPLASLISLVGQKVSKLSFGKFSIEMAQVPEMKPQAMDSEIRELDAGSMPQSGTSGLTALVTELQSGGKRDYVVIDFGSESAPRWLSSRLYLLCFLVTLINRQLCLVFVETVGSVRRKFVGISSPASVRWSLANKFSWFEWSAAQAYSQYLGYPPPGFLDPAGALWTSIPGFISQFLLNIRAAAIPAGEQPSEWVSMQKQQKFEHARWLNGAQIETLLGKDLSTAHVALPQNATLNDLTRPVIAQPGRFVAIVDQNQVLLSLVDRQEVLDNVAREFLNQSGANRS
jgi:hypothetical protein